MKKDEQIEPIYSKVKITTMVDESRTHSSSPKPFK